MRNPRFDILFEPVKIGPVTTPNRFYQVPHCTGMGRTYPKGDALLRATKAEGGWGVVSTQETEIHPTSDLTPSNQGRLWDDNDIPAMRRVADSIHEHGSLAAIQLVHGGLHACNLYSRLPPLGPSHSLSSYDNPAQARAMDKKDISEFRRWHKEAALRAKDCGFDIIYVYAGHDMSLLQHFLLARHNDRIDEYGGSFENRLRLFREVIDDTRSAVGDTCALAIRLAVEELLGPIGLRHDVESRDIIAALADEPDLWDVNLSNWSNDSQTSRFSQEGFQEPYTSFVKSMTSKPVVGVGRYTSPDSMVRVIKKGLFDLIGAARPSIADPFLPNKIKTGNIEHIRECIGCNICTAMDNSVAPIRCTQNPTMGQEWRRGWHPENIPKLVTPEQYLIVGGGPSGLEAARALAQRGADVILADKRGEWGGRVALESKLPGLTEWARVADWRLWQLQQVPNAELYLESPLSADDVLDYNIQNIVFATGATWRNDGRGRHHRTKLPFLLGKSVLTPDDLMSRGVDAIHNEGPVVIFDDDRYYMGSVLAELVAASGREVTFVTPAAIVAPWTEKTLEQTRIQKRLIELDVKIIPNHGIADMRDNYLRLECIYSEQKQDIECGTLISVTSRLPNDRLWHDMQVRKHDWQDAGIHTVNRIGDCLAPGIIADAVYAGHEFARTVENSSDSLIKREDFMKP